MWEYADTHIEKIDNTLWGLPYSDTERLSGSNLLRLERAEEGAGYSQL